MRSGGVVHSVIKPHRALIVAPLLLLLFAVACGGDDDDGGGDSDAPATVRVQLDWTPNTNHIGIYLAQAKGWYEEAGVEVDILPYTDINPDTVVANGNADIGISFPANVIYSRAAGLELVSVAAVLQRSVSEIAVLASSDIERPSDLDGRTYAGFGLPYEAPEIRSVIRADGGEGDFDVATLQTAAYEALYEGRADFSIIFVTWEGIEAELRGVPLRTFRMDDYGLPDFHGVVLVANADALEGEKASALRRFLDATRRGYEYAAENPDAASQEFIDALPEGTFPEPELVRRSTQRLASYFVESGERWGEQAEESWIPYAEWFFEQGLIFDANDQPVAGLSDLPGGPLYTNELLAED